MEGAATISPIPEGQAEAASPRPPLSRAAEETSGARTCCRHHREGHPYKIFFRTPVIDRVATWSSIAPGVRPCSDFARLPAATPWSGFGSGRGAGANGVVARSGGEPGGGRRGPFGPEGLPISSPHIAFANAASLISACAQGEEGGARPGSMVRCFVLSSSSIEGERRGAGISSTRTPL